MRKFGKAVTKNGRKKTVLWVFKVGNKIHKILFNLIGNS